MKTPKTEFVAKALVINEKNEALILKVGLYPARPDKSFKPDLPGGMVDPGETELAAIARELYEEAGIQADQNSFKLVYVKTEFSPRSHTSVTKFLYVIHLENVPEITISWEHASYKWVPLDILLSTVELRPFYKEAIEYVFEHKFF